MMNVAGADLQASSEVTPSTSATAEVFLHALNSQT